jgi:serine/threonine protein phosphatase PrpC
MDNSVWRVIGTSVRGASHIRNGLPNQDGIHWYPGQGKGLPIILAVSDGHGSRKNFRSDRGAGFAVDAAVETMKDFIDRHADTRNLTVIKRIAEERLPKEIVKRWRSAVMSDQGDSGNTPDTTDPFIPYGATLLTVLVTPFFIIYLQLGDGDILTIWKNGEVQRSMPKDERLFGNETTSLCTKDPWRDFRFRFCPILNSPPRLILVSTDGYANSFRDDDSFLQVGSDIWDMVQTDGLDFVNQHLENWLNEASAAGSGDDITMGLICKA